MNKTLILATSLSKLFVEKIIRELHRNDCIVIATDPNANYHLKQVGVPSQLISSDVNQSWKERDSQFAKLAMPGVFGDETFPDTDLELYKVLSIDRLSFWYGGENTKNVIHIIDTLQFDRLLTDLNAHSPIPFAVARRKGIESIAVETMPVRTPEILDTARYFPFDSIVVKEEGEKQFLEKARFPGKIIAGGRDTWKETELVLNPELRRGLGLEGKVVGVVFDKRYEWSARKFMDWFIETNQRAHLVFFTPDSRSRELLLKCLYPYHNMYTLHNDTAVPACDRIYAFAWEDYLRQYNRNLEIVDWYGKSRAAELAPEGVKVRNNLWVE